ncbi:MAG: calcium-translocating P-type ATPase, PMCA-type [Candidatus Diapherotrites archaeon]|nr:calcium-translocating P-type ATPase, PMCA-type [Candidatus Diapherotrites archaeon]
MDYHAQSAKAVMSSLKTTEKGLSNAEARKRLEKYGKNEFAKHHRVSIPEIFLGQFKSFIVLILLAAVVISAALGQLIDTIVISAIVIFNAAFGTIQEYRAEKAMEALESMAAPHAVVIRGGKEKVIPASELVPGDIIVLETGDSVPADARIIQKMNLKCQESALTGESVPEDKSASHAAKDAHLAERTSMVYMHTTVAYGHARAVVTATGMQTEMGRIAHFIKGIQDVETPMQRRLDELGKKLGLVILVICGLLFVLEIIESPEILAHFLAFRGDLSLLFAQLAGTEIVELFLVAVSLAVSAIPEGLPAVVTITLAVGLQRMAKRNAVVRKLPAVETLGSTTVICTDKTGTLTRNEMTVTKVFVNNEVVDVSGTGYEPTGKFSKTSAELKRLLEIGVHCNNADLVHDDSWGIIGDPTEGCLLTLAAKGGVHESLHCIDELAFDSKRKRMTTLHRAAGGTVAFMKGAPESVLSVCTHALVNGKTVKLSARDKQRIMKQNNDFASSALRVLAFAYRDLPEKFSKKDAESKMVFVGLAGMIDPPRPEAKSAIARARQAGIRVVMITGDNELTARAIATKLGLAGEEEGVVTGRELDRLGDKALPTIVGRTTIYARVSPEHKLKIVRAMQAQGEVVAVTGDGVNDAPALKTADIGIAMGITGTDVSKEASDIILADDNFASIVAAVEEGRCIYGNIRNFIKYLLSANCDEIIVVAGAALVGLPLPFLPVQILWINLVTDGFPALALGLDPPDPDVMNQKPRSKEQSVFHGIGNVVVMAGLIAAVITFIAFLTGLGTSVEKGRTMAFTASVLFELFFVFNCRSVHQSLFNGLFENRFLVGAIGLSLLLQLAVIYVPFMNTLFGTVPLALDDWLLILPLSLTALLPFLGNFWKKS